jgi:methyl-accepting chemotaxis protein
MNVSPEVFAAQRNRVFADINKKSDRIMNIALTLYFILGIVFAFFYDTYLIAVGAGGLSLVSYYTTKTILPDSGLYRYVLAVIVGIFSAQYIYQMHGMFEMHFFFFVGSALLITFQNWKLQIPLLVFVLLHHGIFAYLQYSGMKGIYFTQLDYMNLQAFVIHAAVAGVILFINALWGYNLGIRTFSEMQAKSELEAQVKNIKRNIIFAEEISKGNLNIDYNVSSDDDELGKSLFKMQHNLIEANIRDTAEKYITAGIATIGGILRKHTDTLDTLSYELVNEMSKYTGSSQGSVFLLDKDTDGSEYLKLTACYAYDRKKYMEKRIAIGDSLVGQCFLEKEIIIMKKVPREYVKITSGLGLATPTCIIIVPLLANGDVTGVMEFASFTPYSDGQIEFMKKASEAIATSFLSVKTTERIRILLAESQQREEEMRSQEEEMRQNMEELSATQEEMKRNTTEMESRIEAINVSGIASIEFSLDGIILSANPSFLKLMGYTLEEIAGKHHRIFVDEQYARTEEYKQFWQDLAAGVARPGEYERVRKNGSQVYIHGSYSAIRDRNGKPLRVLKLATDITAHKIRLLQTVA